MGIVMRASKGEGEVLIYDGIGESFWGDGVTAKGFRKDLDALGAVSKLTVRINSGGGDVFDGIAIYEAIARHSASQKVVVVDGLAASIASIVATAGSEIHIAPGGFFMIHNARGAVWGEAQEMRRQADLIDSVSAQMANIYVSRIGATQKRVKEWMDAETWFDADAAIAHGFADKKTDEVMKVAACVDLAKFRNVPPQLRGALPTPRLDAVRARIAASRR